MQNELYSIRAYTPVIAMWNFSWHRVIVYMQHWLYYLHLENEKKTLYFKNKDNLRGFYSFYDVYKFTTSDSKMYYNTKKNITLYLCRMHYIYVFRKIQ